MSVTGIEVKTKVHRMLGELLDLAEIEFDLPKTFRTDLKVRISDRKVSSTAGYRMRAGVKIPIMNINIGWILHEARMGPKVRLKNYREFLDNWEKTGWMTSPGRRALGATLLKAIATKGYFENEYKSIAADPEIGATVFDDYDGKIALTLAHELAHAIDLAASGHGEPWKKLYRVLRTKYVNNGAYKNKPAEVIPLPITPRPVEVPADIRLAGLPLFDIAA